MKKIILVSLIIMLLCGCSKVQGEAVAVLEKAETDSGLVVFMDEDLNVVKTIEIGYPEDVLQSDQQLFVSIEEQYWLFDIGKCKKNGTASSVKGQLLYCDGADYISSYYDALIIYHDEETEEINLTVEDSASYNGAFYVLDDQGYITIIDLSSYTVTDKINASYQSPMGFSIIDEKLYLIQADGMALIENNSISMVYVYPFDYDQIANVIGNHVILYQGEEMVVYQVSFDKYRMNYQLEMEDKWYASLNYSELFSNYYQQGYQCIYFSF